MLGKICMKLRNPNGREDLSGFKEFEFREGLSASKEYEFQVGYK